MTDRGILFSAPMVRALLDGTKTQTRRALRVQPLDVLPMEGDSAGREWVGLMQREPKPAGTVFRCKFGQPGDRLWVRESFSAYGRWETRFSERKKRDEWRFVDMTRECGHEYEYAADDAGVPVAKRGGATPAWHARPAIYMPRVASRIMLEIVAVRVERLQNIDDQDAIAEGIGLTAHAAGVPMTTPAGETVPRAMYRTLWDSINGPGSWHKNPWVWVVNFKRRVL